MALLTDDEVTRFVEEHPGWNRDGAEIRRVFTFTDFTQAMGFVTKVALVAEKADHHPDIDIRWNRVTLALSTHSAGGITEKDLDLASACDGLA